jgi:hypothetical protein
MPTLKAIHIRSRYSQRTVKTAKEYVFANANTVTNIEEDNLKSRTQKACG